MSRFLGGWAGAVQHQPNFKDDRFCCAWWLGQELFAQDQPDCSLASLVRVHRSIVRNGRAAASSGEDGFSGSRGGSGDTHVLGGREGAGATEEGFPSGGFAGRWCGAQGTRHKECQLFSVR